MTPAGLLEHLGGQQLPDQQLVEDNSLPLPDIIQAGRLHIKTFSCYCLGESPPPLFPEGFYCNITRGTLDLQKGPVVLYFRVLARAPVSIVNILSHISLISHF